MFPFDVPFAYSGSQPFGWELRLYGSTAAGAYFVDSYESDANNGRVIRTGLGCVATGQTARMTLYPSIQTRRPTNDVRIGWSLTYGPAWAPALFLYAIQGINLPVPGLCANLYVHDVFLTLAASSNQSGTAIAPQLLVPWDPTLAGVTLHGQGVCADAGQTGLRLAVTDGARSTIEPMPEPPLGIFRLRASTPTETTGVTDSNAQYGLAVRLLHK